MGYTADSGGYICAVSDFYMEVYRKSAVLIGADDDALALEKLSPCQSGNGGAKGTYAAHVRNAEAAAHRMAYKLGDISLGNGDLTDMIFKTDHSAHPFLLLSIVAIVILSYTLILYHMKKIFTIDLNIFFEKIIIY